MIEITEGVRFDQMGLSPEMMRAINKRGLTVTTPVQAGCIPPMMEWKDVIAKAPTGTGKTFAFGIPIIQHIDPESEEVQAVILAPTRELAIQTTEEMRDLAEFFPGVRLVCLYGGQPINKQIDTLKRKPQIVVATPGRLDDHIKRRTVRIDTAQTVILDEADRMLDMGFIHDVTRILDRMKTRKNLGMFSATISREVMDIAWVYQRDAVEITVQADEKNKPDILQFRMEISQGDKADMILRLMKAGDLERAMVFCNTKGSTERMSKFLQMQGADADCIHGDIPQKKREEVLERFRKGELHIFVATDVAARGIDVDDVDAVFNCDVPDENEYYVHRIGRTGRAKRHGVAFTFVSDYPGKMRLDEIARLTKNTIMDVKIGEDGTLTEVEEAIKKD
ncbi:MAG: DEAD/DEAH box helicase [Oscillospiraceae bacterium]